MMADQTDFIQIRRAVEADLDQIMNIIKLSIPILHEGGNFQWTDSYPARINFTKDLSDGNLFVAVDTATQDSEGEVVGVIAYTETPVPAYEAAGVDVSELCIIPHRCAVHPHHRVT